LFENTELIEERKKLLPLARKEQNVKERPKKVKKKKKEQKIFITLFSHLSSSLI
tara:strand:- start:177 stop:338 length:162 start_codon:yes stop_codon:yes gene_type:complete